jgi:deoxyribonuclease V
MKTESARAAQQSAPVAVVDVHYDGDRATAACVVAAFWTDGHAAEERVTRVSNVLPYKPGAFFERELPCILAVLSLVQTGYRTIVIDGYVDLDEHGTPGLGGHLHEHLGGRVGVVGVAKTAFRGSLFAARVLRGVSHNPLYVTARGLVPEEAAELVQRMHGGHRIPTLLRRVDGLARGLLSPSPY